MSSYYPPKFLTSAFNCIYCQAYSRQDWYSMVLTNQHRSAYYTSISMSDFNFCICSHCHEKSLWVLGKMVYPNQSTTPMAHPEMPTPCLDDYNEAREILAISPRSAAALIRLAIQKLMIELGEKGKNINDDIKSLVEKGLPVQVQQALDYCRIVGNNAVHPGEINLDDSPEIAQNLFTMINLIVEDRIAKPKQIDEFYNRLPQSARDAIENRDKPKIS